MLDVYKRQQLLMFYVFPLTAGPTDAMGMVFLIIVATFVLAIIMGSVSTVSYTHLITALMTCIILGHLDGLGIGTILAAFTMGKVRCV